MIYDVNSPYFKRFLVKKATSSKNALLSQIQLDKVISVVAPTLGPTGSV
jgi:hypothetical protein